MCVVFYFSNFLSSRCAVIRRMVDDITNTTKKQKLALTIKQARQYYDKLFIIIEKNKVKKGNYSWQCLSEFSE